jgi:hypothetical protein
MERFVHEADLTLLQVAQATMDDVPDEKSFFSTSAQRNPRDAASRATPSPVTPPPMTTTSKVSDASRSSISWRLAGTRQG